MRLPFLDRDEETARLRRLLESPEGSLAVLYGRRRCGKSRLLREVLPRERSIYYVGDEREGPLQRASLAAEIARLLPGFDRVTYPDWDALLGRAEGCHGQSSAKATALGRFIEPAKAGHLQEAGDRGVDRLVTPR
jgi:AAA+ ATPase superfamily predicted ATPase